MDYKIWYTEDSINCNERKVCFVKRKKFLARVLSLSLALLLYERHHLKKSHEDRLAAQA